LKNETRLAGLPATADPRNSPETKRPLPRHFTGTSGLPNLLHKYKIHHYPGDNGMISINGITLPVTTRHVNVHGKLKEAP
jgi:hypothetical protein